MRFEPPWDGAFRFQTYYRRTPEALPEAAIARIREAILASTLLADTNLTRQFEGTYGFSIAFTRAGLPELAIRFEAFGPFLEAALLPGADAFLLNPLLIRDGKGVEAHIDQSLEVYRPGIGCPLAVSVLYVQVPEGLAGGELRLSHRGREVAVLPPAPRSLLSFRGDLVHSVSPVALGAPGLASARISLVVEQYRVPPGLQDALPAFDLRSRSGAPA